jgi:hypothetical protein
MINFLLKLLEAKLDVDKPNSVKAQISKTIKAMLNSLQHLPQVNISINRIY